MSAILFLDPVCQRPYDTRTLATQASGGTEASLTRIADALDAFVMQHNRAEAWGRYLPVQPVALGFLITLVAALISFWFCKRNYDSERLAIYG